MSFIDYNFFPILFFLGWNILTTKQFRPTSFNSSDSKMLSALSVSSLTDLTNSKIIQTDLKSEKKSNIFTGHCLEFVSKFQFWSQNQKLILKETDHIKSIAKSTQWFNLPLMKKRSGCYSTNHNLVNNSWKINFKSNFFDFT